MTFHAPLLLLLVPVALLGAGWLAAYAARKRHAALALFLGPRAGGVASAALARQRRVRAGLVGGALALGLVALAGPTFGTTTRETRRESLDLVIALDVSNSMRTPDVAPSRLERARLDVRRLLDARAGDRVALVVFAGDAFVQCPLTTDLSAVRLFLDAAGPDVVAVQGTNFAGALEAAEQAFDATTRRPRALVVVSDGEDHEGGLDEAAARLREQGVALFALGVGTDAGAPVPDPDTGGARRDADGEPVVSRYEPGALRQIAGADHVVRAGRGATDRLTDQLDRLDRAELAGERIATGAERFQWPLALALLLLVAERLLAARPVTRSPRPHAVAS